jgi:hypothetical protein
MYLVKLYAKHAMIVLLIRQCDPVHEKNKSRPILIKFNESWPNVAQWFRTSEEPKIENSNSERCDIAGLLLPPPAMCYFMSTLHYAIVSKKQETGNRDEIKFAERIRYEQC